MKESDKFLLKKLESSAKEGTLEPEQLLNNLNRLSSGHRRPGLRITGQTRDFFRTRTFNSDDKLPVATTDIAYPPQKSALLGRANRPEESIFYASIGMPTTLAESRAKKGDIIVSGRWKNIEELILQSVGFSGKNLGLEGVYNGIFTSDNESMYKYSSIIAKHLMNGDQIHGISYPSIISGGRSQNVALKKSTVDTNMRLIYASAFRVKELYKNGSYRLEEIDFAIPDDSGKLIWTGRKHKWVLRKQGDELTVISNGWDWDAYLPDGTWVSPE